MKTGRKSLKEEMAVLERFNQLAPRVFEFVGDMLDSELLEDRKWAADWIKPGFAKMIPQQVTGANGGPIQVQVLTVEQIAALDKLITSDVNPTSPQQSNQWDTSGTKIPL